VLPQKFLKAVIIGLICLIPFSAFALTGYTVTSGDSLWRIASKNKPSQVSTANMIVAIKGLNQESYPSINDNIVQSGQSLTLPTSSSEVNDAIKLFNHSQKAYLEPIQAQPINKPEPAQQLAQQNTQLKSEYQHYQQEVDVTIDTLKTQNTQLDDKLVKADEKNKIGWGVAIVLFILLLFVWRKKRKKSKAQTADLAKQRFTGGTPSDANVEPSFMANGDHSITLNVNEALVEAMILFEEGNTQDAKLCLQSTLDTYPDSIDVRIKLIEIYAAENDVVSFNSERDYLSAHHLPHDDDRWEEIDQIYTKYFIK
jgi:Tfp pilus assembly protein FimV